MELWANARGPSAGGDVENTASGCKWMIAVNKRKTSMFQLLQYCVMLPAFKKVAWLLVYGLLRRIWVQNLVLSPYALGWNSGCSFVIATGNNGKTMLNGESLWIATITTTSRLWSAFIPRKQTWNRHGHIEVPIWYGTGRLEVQEAWNILEDDAPFPFPCHHGNLRYPPNATPPKK